MMTWRSAFLFMDLGVVLAVDLLSQYMSVCNAVSMPCWLVSLLRAMIEVLWDLGMGFGQCLLRVCGRGLLVALSIARNCLP